MKNMNLLTIKLKALTNILLLILFLAQISCNNQKNDKNTLIEILPKRNSINNIDTLFVNLINPYDCLNCMPSIKFVLNEILLKENKKNVFTYIIIPKIRVVELNKFKKEYLLQKRNYIFISDDSIFNQIKELVNVNQSSSFLIVFDVNKKQFKLYDYYEYKSKYN